jgi:hypothetical protein
MNYSQRKHIERLLADAPDLDPFGLRSFHGLRVIEAALVPRYEMPEWLVKPTDKHDGVRWDPKLREETNRWALEFLGTTCLVPRGTVYMIAGGYSVMHPADVVKLRHL